jgi:sulfopyruvate decarboxylase alpha subunit
VDWGHAAHAALRSAGVTIACYVPDAGLATLISDCRDDPAITTVALTTEQEGIALACGAWLGGGRTVVMMQSSGVGNCINMLGLVRTGQFPLLALVTMRGEWGERNPWQVPMGRATPAVLEAMGVGVIRVEDTATIPETLAAAADMAFLGGQAIAVLVAQRVLGAKAFAEDQS